MTHAGPAGSRSSFDSMGYRSRVQFIGVLAHTMATGTITAHVVSVLAPFLRDDLGASRSQIGWLIAIFAFVSMAASPLAGSIADRFGGRSTVFGVLSFGIATGVWMALSPSYWWLSGAAVLGGFANSGANPGTNKLITAHLPLGKRGTAMGLKQSGVQAGVFLCGLGLPPIANAVGWRLAAFAVAPFALVGLLVALRSIPPDGSARVGHSVRSAESTVPTGMVWMLSLYAVLMGAGSAALAAFLPLYGTEEVGLSPAVAGATSAAMGITALVARILWGRKTEHVRSFFTPLAWLAGLAGCAALLLWSASGSHGLVWAGAALAGTSASSWTVVAMLGIVVRVPAVHAGRMTARLYAGFMAGYAIGPAAIGASVDASGSWGVGWAIILALFVGSLLLALVSSDARPADRAAGVTETDPLRSMGAS